MGGMGNAGSCNPSTCHAGACQDPHAEESVKPGESAEELKPCVISNGRLEDHYELGMELGKGAQGFVYACRDRITGVQRAAKLMDANKNSATAAFQREVHFLGLSRSTVVHVVDVFMQHNFNAIVMEKFEGHVKAMVKEHATRHKSRQGILSDRALQHVMRQALRAVSYLHESNVVHRDVKATNFLVDRMNPEDPELRVVICDFGLARQLEAGKFLSCPVGTRRYWAPEMYDQSYWHAVDIFALGVMLFLVASLTYPFQSKEETQMRSVLPPDGLRPPATEFLQHLLVKRPKRRLPAHVLSVHAWISDGNEDLLRERERHCSPRRSFAKSKSDLSGGPWDEEETSARLPDGGYEISLPDGVGELEGWESELIFI